MASLGSSELWPRDMPGWGTDWILGDFPRVLGSVPMTISRLYQLSHLFEVSMSIGSRCSWLFCDHWKPLALQVGTRMPSSVKTPKQLAEKWIFRPPWKPLRLCGAGQLTWLVPMRLLGRLAGVGSPLLRKTWGSSEEEHGWPSHWAAHLGTPVFTEALGLSLEKSELVIESSRMAHLKRLPGL